MARKKSGDKRSYIIKATVSEVVENGLNATSINVIAKRAQVSVGTVYLYFDNKEELLSAVYLDVKRGIHSTLIDALNSTQNTTDRLKLAWFSMLEYASENPNDFLFSEVLGNVDFLSIDDLNKIDELSTELRGFLEEGIADGTLKQENISAIATMFMAPLLALARQNARANTQIDRNLAETIYQMCWAAIASS